MKDINVAVIGWGFMGRTHTHSLRCIPLMYKDIDFRPVLKLVTSGHVENAQAAARDAGFEEYAADWRTILDRKDIDAVSVCTPNSLHEEMVTALLDAGKNLYIDKPLTCSLDSALRIKAAADRSGSVCQMVMNNRFLPATMRAAQLAREGALGDITAFSCRYLHSGSVEELKPMGWKQGLEGGVILDLASHALDLVTNITGQPEEVMCAVNTLYPGRVTKQGGYETAISEDHAVITMRLPGGAVGYCEASKIATGTNDELTFEIYGKKGAIRFDLMDPNWLWYFDNTVPEAPLGGRRGFTRIECVGRFEAPAGTFLPPKNAVGWDRGHVHCYYSFLDAVAHGKQPSPSIDDAVRLQALMEAAKQSVSDRAWVKVPLI